MTFADIVAVYGASAKRRLAGPGEREALLVTPIAQFIEEAGALMGRQVVPHDEVSEFEGSVRDLLTDVLAGPLLTRAQLANDGVAWASRERDHQARISATGTLALGLDE